MITFTVHTFPPLPHVDQAGSAEERRGPASVLFDLLETPIEYMRPCLRCDRTTPHVARRAYANGLLSACQCCGEEIVEPYSRTIPEAIA